MSNQGKTVPVENFLNPSVLRSNLIVMGLYIAAYELLHDSVVERPRRFFGGYDENSNFVTGPHYDAEVLQGKKKILPASLVWLKNKDVINEADIENFEKAKKLRDDLTHEMGRILWEGLPVDLPERFSDIVSLVDKIEGWWTQNEVDLPKGQIAIPGMSIGLRMLMEIAIGSDEDSRKYLDEYIRLTRPSGFSQKAQ